MPKRSGKCFYCETYYERLTRDHVLPRCKGGTGLQNNIVMSCTRCNGYKGFSTLREFLYTMEHYTPAYFIENNLASTVCKNIRLLIENNPAVLPKLKNDFNFKVVGKIELPPVKTKKKEEPIEKATGKKKVR